MAEYKVFFKHSAVKELETLPQKDLQRILKHIESLKTTPRPPACEKLSVQERYRIRQGNYRSVYSVQDADGSLQVVKIGHRMIPTQLV
jgi:mRNA interferase RelE/StbE